MSSKVIISIIGLLVVVVSAWYLLGSSGTPLAPNVQVPAPILGPLDPLAPSNQIGTVEPFTQRASSTEQVSADEDDSGNASIETIE